MLKLILFLLFTQLTGSTVFSQRIDILASGRETSLRGLSVVSDRVIWVCGSNGTVARSADSGHSWHWMKPSRFADADFRDIHAYNDSEALVLGVTRPAVILKTRDGGRNWQVVFQSDDDSLFLDAMELSGPEGLLLGDPVQGKIFLARTTDSGQNWTRLNDPPSASAGEAFFAASGSNICLLPHGRYAFVSGGLSSRLFLDSLSYKLSLNQGKVTTGANSISVSPSNPNSAFITGGDFNDDRSNAGNSLLVQLNPFSQKKPVQPPHGYRSCVDWVNAHDLVACGTSGIDWSSDGGMHWRLISDKGFHVCRKSPGSNLIFLAGPKGTIGRLQ